MGCSPPFMGSFPPIVASSSPYVEFTGSHGDLRLFEDRGFLMWLVFPLANGVGVSSNSSSFP
uniref:Uncharacterized protein n=1 Tax=Fagus sylvatica TaxID=28930 RepID=A0A2N9J7Q8_FAGSY